ncbi:thiosulfate/3-mercaptopyruvate sulfurtransferase [Tistlia consotensis]|uniref:3-mercaptopyruvate sulfurtransferase n=1 Tax=Tistlia consotensis USBA 355 TaxID=560819 RepID=A0A1Y6BJW1_9PROT|nr:3-mercaptopyruvate sulfurtransferase [Tistlia consotensis]SMF04907.1 thiosulfate/3-mercaptopyruvate sulfurtransferase [Tistlia consotensis USBA 355]SNR54899.1 thiosulfate/3-mercaptopyruvate sulfurtransferase [Tistlia consotensis]
MAATSSTRRGDSLAERCLVSTDWLAEHLSAPDVRVVDATYFLPIEGRDARAEYAAQHIPGAVFFDIDDVKDPSNPLPHMLPPPEVFSSKVRKLGLGDGNRIVVYDSRGLFSAPRVWWTFRIYGHEDVAVLDGGLPKWLAEGRAVDDHPVLPMERHFTVRMNSLLLRELEQVQANIASGREQLLDARAAERFRGEVEEVRPGQRRGHIPGSLNLPFLELSAPDGTLLPPDRLRERFAAAGIDPRRPVVTTCGSGVTACVLLLGLARIGAGGNLAVYDGSWSEWGLPDGPPIETGPAQASGPGSAG